MPAGFSLWPGRSDAAREGAFPFVYEAAYGVEVRQIELTTGCWD